ncbi:hypothetical protein [Halanaerobium salsuginis]|jgi:hypothetical protein|uniref:Motility protein n=1 Tax=Halanaerobium salsuginis TaxID=29563 RepID=A0A1I4L268_9FIRM|nr:hypothetical protein [Halanaerobium salsuginis]SFL85021.1 hypothetical protein SAMN02983006_02187 [Halanaerobium salsuginis]
MDVNAAMQSQIASVQQSLSMFGLQQAMGMDAGSVSKLIEGMQETTAAVSQARAAGPGRGQNINVMA